MTMEEIDRLELRYEVARKAIHLSSLSIPVIYWFISRELALFLLVPLFSGFFLIDLLKNFFTPVSVWYHKTFGAMLRTHELKKAKAQLNGATYIVMAALLLVLFFPKIIAVAAFQPWSLFQIPLPPLLEKLLENIGLDRKAWREAPHFFSLHWLLLPLYRD